MQCTIQTLTTRQPGQMWYSEAEPIKYKIFRNWVETYPGVTRTLSKRLSETEHLRITTFVDQATMEQFILDRNAREDYQEKINWCTSNNNLVESQILGL